MSQPTEPKAADVVLSDEARVLSGPVWAELRVFLAVAQAKSFNRAAEELNMSQPTVSRQVRRLQDYMGTQLLVTTQAGIILTDKGRELATSLQMLDRQLAQISSDLAADARAAEGVVQVEAGAVLAGMFMAPALVRFHEDYPKIRLQMRTLFDPTYSRSAASDVMLGYAPSDRPDVTTRALGVMHLLPMAARSYIERYGVPTRSNLSSHFFVQCDTYTPEVQTFDPWLSLITRGVTAHSSDSALAYGMMVKSGLGIGLLGSYLLDEPSLIPLELGVCIPIPLFALARTDRLASRPVRLVYDWLSEVFSPDIPWFSPDFNLERLPRDTLTAILAQLSAGPRPSL